MPEQLDLTMINPCMTMHKQTGMEKGEEDEEVKNRFWVETKHLAVSLRFYKSKQVKSCLKRSIFLLFLKAYAFPSIKHAKEGGRV